MPQRSISLVISNMELGIQLTRILILLHNLLAEWPRASYLTLLSLIMKIHKVVKCLTKYPAHSKLSLNGRHSYYFLNIYH